MQRLSNIDTNGLVRCIYISAFYYFAFSGITEGFSGGDHFRFTWWICLFLGGIVGVTMKLAYHQVKVKFAFLAIILPVSIFFLWDGGRFSFLNNADIRAYVSGMFFFLALVSIYKNFRSDNVDSMDDKVLTNHRGG